MIPHHRNLALLKQYDFRFHPARKNKHFFGNRSKVFEFPMFAEPKSVCFPNVLNDFQKVFVFKNKRFLDPVQKVRGFPRFAELKSA